MSDTPASRALEDMAEMDLLFPQVDDRSILEMCDSFYANHEETIRRALRIAHAVDSGELVNKTFPKTDWAKGEQFGCNACLERLKKIGDE